MAFRPRAFSGGRKATARRNGQSGGTPVHFTARGKSAAKTTQGVHVKKQSARSIYAGAIGWCAAALVGGQAVGAVMDVKLGETIPRKWADVETDGYAYAPKQAFNAKTGETQIWLPYGAKGVYYETSGIPLWITEVGYQAPDELRLRRRRPLHLLPGRSDLRGLRQQAPRDHHRGETDVFRQERGHELDLRVAEGLSRGGRMVRHSRGRRLA